MATFYCSRIPVPFWDSWVYTSWETPASSFYTSHPRPAPPKKRNYLPLWFKVWALFWVTKILGFLGLKGFPGCGTFHFQVGTVLGKLGWIDHPSSDKSCEPGFKSQLCCIRAVWPCRKCFSSVPSFVSNNNKTWQNGVVLRSQWNHTCDQWHSTWHVGWAHLVGRICYYLAAQQTFPLPLREQSQFPGLCWIPQGRGWEAETPYCTFISINSLNNEHMHQDLKHIDHTNLL